MQLLLHASAQRTGTGDGPNLTEPNLKISGLIVNVSQISVNLLGSITIKVQHSADGSTWFDIPNLATTGLTATGDVFVGLSSPFIAGDYIQVVYTFANANSITFAAYIVGEK